MTDSFAFFVGGRHVGIFEEDEELVSPWLDATSSFCEVVVIGRPGPSSCQATARRRLMAMRRVVDIHPALGHHLFKVRAADPIPAEPADTEQDELGWKLTALERKHRGERPKNRLLVY